MKTFNTCAAAIAIAVLAAASTTSLSSATAATNPITCQSGPIAPASVNYVASASICKNSTTKQTRITGKISGLSKTGGHITVQVSTYRKTVSVCGAEDKTIDTGWLSGNGNWMVQYADGGCPSRG
ncbi:hypothetical protein [Streptomyces sp. RKAG290]|uniref:hypothetical protein n=1 Tax=Streptomyces sp. RKAG290 TaxID=2888348 RepID=UPI0020345D08|nr:hypothetical protein [Streptomyces sp. RKAG290]MCM2412170.1 hypothetical protein [Streptomyces sp. RKAG290]